VHLTDRLRPTAQRRGGGNRERKTGSGPLTTSWPVQTVQTALIPRRPRWGNLYQQNTLRRPRFQGLERRNSEGNHKTSTKNYQKDGEGYGEVRKTAESERHADFKMLESRYGKLQTSRSVGENRRLKAHEREKKGCARVLLGFLISSCESKPQCRRWNEKTKRKREKKICVSRREEGREGAASWTAVRGGGEERRGGGCG